MTDYSLFLGSFHPILVHLPIGVLVAAFALHLLSRVPRFGGLYPAVGWLYALAAVGGVAAVISGWALAGPTGASWDTHRWFGLGALAAGILTAFFVGKKQRADWTGIGLAALTLGLTGWTGHLGGAITHGEGHFAQYAPDGFGAPDTLAEVMILDPDSVVVYTKLIAPMLGAHCMDCHRAELHHGKLRMDSYAALLRGGKEGNAITAGANGELWKRISLPPDHPRFMPTRGTPLSYDQLNIMASWLEAEKDSLLTVTAWAPDEAVLAAIERSYRLNLRPLPYVERARPAAVALDAVPNGWEIRPLSATHTTLVVRHAGGDLKALTPYAGNITELDLRGMQAADEKLSQLPEMPHLTNLNLSKTATTDAALASLKRYPHLETLNLTQTKITDAGLATLNELPALQRLYLYGTAVSAEGLTAFREQQEAVEIPERFAFGAGVLPVE